MAYDIRFSQEKNQLLIYHRGISFTDVIEALSKGGLLDDISHFRQEDYPNQRILLVNINQYVCAVPYVINHDKKELFLKTIYPSRKLTKEYLK